MGEGSGGEGGGGEGGGQVTAWVLRREGRYQGDKVQAEGGGEEK